MIRRLAFAVAIGLGVVAMWLGLDWLSFWLLGWAVTTDAGEARHLFFGASVGASWAADWAARYG